MKTPGKRLTTAERPLPADRTFVLQLRSDADVRHGQLAGRIEHVVSGRSTHFASLDEVVAFVQSLVAAGGTSL